MQEYKKKGKGNTFVDRRFGENDDGLGEEDKAIMRFQKERQVISSCSLRNILLFCYHSVVFGQVAPFTDFLIGSSWRSCDQSQISRQSKFALRDDEDEEEEEILTHGGMALSNVDDYKDEDNDSMQDDDYLDGCE